MKIFNLRANRGDHTRRLMSKCEGFSHKNIAIAVVVKVMEIRTTESGTQNGNLHFIRPRRFEDVILLHHHHHHISSSIQLVSNESTYYPQILDSMED
jgi:hypothetical protein